VGCYGTYACIPFSSQYIGSDITLGLFFIVAISSLVVAGIMMAGWVQINKYAYSVQSGRSHRLSAMKSHRACYYDGLILAAR